MYKFFNESLLSMKPVQIPSFMFIGTMVIELREFKKKNMDKMWKLFLALIRRVSGIYSFVLTCSML